MKSNVAILGLCVAAGLMSCKSEEETRAEKTVESYTTYVDSLGGVAEADARANWSAIEADYMQRTTDAEAALANMKDREKAEERLNASKAKYEEMRARYQAAIDAERNASNNAGSSLSATLFPMGTVGNDMNFDWVNKDNILRVYNDFNNAYDENKDKFSREDFDKIKQMYEALDARKNTVEKEGLSSEDNRKIAELKFKFGPRFKVDRMGAKTAENENAKEEAN